MKSSVAPSENGQHPSLQLQLALLVSKEFENAGRRFRTTNGANFVVSMVEKGMGLWQSLDSVMDPKDGEWLERNLTPEELGLMNRTEYDLRRELALQGDKLADGGYLPKPSRDPTNAIDANRRWYMKPEAKMRTHTESNHILGEGYNAQLTEGVYRVEVTEREAREFGVSRNNRQYHKLNELVRALSERGPDKNRQGRLLELMEDLKGYDTSVFPTRKLHQGLMAHLESAVNQNARIQIELVTDYGVPAGYTLHRVH